jgi:hypothetical protein
VVHLFLAYPSGSSLHLLTILSESGPGGLYGLLIHHVVGLLAIAVLPQAFPEAPAGVSPSHHGHTHHGHDIMGVYLTSVCLTSMNLMGVRLTGVHLMGIHFMGMTSWACI